MTKKYEDFYDGRKLLELTSVGLYFDTENGDLYQMGIDNKPQWETRFNVLDRDGRSYDYEKFDKLLNEEDAKAVMSFLYDYISKQAREMNKGK
jgi:hypothetical protein